MDSSGKVIKVNELKKLIKSSLKDGPEQKENVADMISDWGPKGSGTSLYEWQVVELIDGSPDYYHLALSLLRYAFHHSDDEHFDFSEWCEIVNLLGPNALSDKELQANIMTRLLKSANSVGDYLAIASQLNKSPSSASESGFWLDKAESAVVAFDDAYLVIDHPLCTLEIASRILALVES